MILNDLWAMPNNTIDKCMNQIRNQFQGPDVSNQAAENQNQSSHLQNSQAAWPSSFDYSLLTSKPEQVYYISVSGCSASLIRYNGYLFLKWNKK